MKVANQTTDQDQIKVCLYNEADGVDWAPVGGGVFVVKKGDTVTWTAPSGEERPMYHMKVFHPSFIDGYLCAADRGPDGNVAVRGGNGNYSISDV